MTHDDILQEIGEFGPYQKMVYFFLCTPAIMKAIVVLSAVFILHSPDYRCAIPGLPNDTFLVQSDSHKHLVNLTIPPALADQEQGGSYSHCSVYTNRTVEYHQPERWATLNLSDEVSDCQSWVYDRSEVHTSMLTEYNFVCDNVAMRSHANMGFFSGSLIGSFVIGVVADLVGRKKALLLSIAIQIACGISLYFIVPMVAVVVVRSFQGASIVMYSIATATGMELVGPSKRAFAGMVVQFFWSLGQLLVLLVSYVSKDWRVSELVYGICAVPVFLLACTTPESPRWLTDKQRFVEAEKILKRIAKSNKKKFPDNILQSHSEESGSGEVKPWKILRNWIILGISVIIFYNWFAVNFLYYGLSLNLDNLSGSLYINFLIGLAVETVGFILGLVLLSRTGRKRLYIVCTFIGAVACLAVNFPVVFGNEDHHWIITALAMLGKMMASCCYSVLYIISVEVFPTVIRNSALGICAVFENVAGMVSPYAADLGILLGGSLSRALPTTVFGVVGLLAAILSLFIPETLHQPLPETLEDTIKLCRWKKPSKSPDETVEEGHQNIDSRL